MNLRKICAVLDYEERHNLRRYKLVDVATGEVYESWPWDPFYDIGEFVIVEFVAGKPGPMKPVPTVLKAVPKEGEDETRSDAARRFWEKNWFFMMPSNGRGKFVYHHHWRGLSEEEADKATDRELMENTDHSVHGDLRLESDDALWGFTVFLGSTKENRKFEVDRFVNGKEQIQGTFKLAQPKAWLKVGVGKPAVSEPGGVGSTSKKWSKFFAIDTGTYRLGVAREHYYFEVFLNGRHLKGRYHIQSAPIGGQRVWLISKPENQTPYAKQHSLSSVIKDMEKDGESLLVWSDGDKGPYFIDLKIVGDELKKRLEDEQDEWKVLAAMKSKLRKPVQKQRLPEEVAEEIIAGSHPIFTSDGDSVYIVHKRAEIWVTDDKGLIVGDRVFSPDGPEPVSYIEEGPLRIAFVRDITKATIVGDVQAAFVVVRQLEDAAIANEKIPESSMLYLVADSEFVPDRGFVVTPGTVVVPGVGVRSENVPVQKDEAGSTPEFGQLVFEKSSEKRYTFGPVYLATNDPEHPIEDFHHEYITAEELQEAQWNYVRSGDRTIYLQHGNEPAGEWVDIVAWPMEVRTTLRLPTGEENEVVIPANSVWMGIVWNERTWALVKEGKIRGLSMGGRGRRV